MVLNVGSLSCEQNDRQSHLITFGHSTILMLQTQTSTATAPTQVHQVMVPRLEALSSTTACKTRTFAVKERVRDSSDRSRLTRRF